MRVLVLNSGSSSVKYKLYEMRSEEDYDLLGGGAAERIGIENSFIEYDPAGRDSVKVQRSLRTHEDALKEIIALLTDPDNGILNRVEEIECVGHRVVHGGEDFKGSVLIDGKVVKAICKNAILAPLHNPPNLAGIEAMDRILPEIPQVAVFDTAVHQTMPSKAYLYALPSEQYEKYKIRRYGFHGTSHRYVSQKAAKVLEHPLEDLKLITCHIGNGVSLTAFDHGRSVDTSMGLTPLEGAMMGTRSGDLDPYVPLHIMQTQNLKIDEVSNMLNRHGGLLGVCGKRDMRDILAGAEEGDEKSRDALEMFIYRLQKYIGAYTAAMGGVDGIVFTAGIGEHVALVRKRILANFSYLGLELDEEANLANETVVTTPNSRVTALVVPTKEELVIARDAFLIAGEGSRD